MVGVRSSQEQFRMGTVLLGSCYGRGLAQLGIVPSGNCHSREVSRMGSCYGRGFAQLGVVPSWDLSWWEVVPSGDFSRWGVVPNVKLFWQGFSLVGICPEWELSLWGVVPNEELLWQGFGLVRSCPFGNCRGRELPRIGSCYGRGLAQLELY